VVYRALVKFLIRCLACDQLDLKSLNPCDGECYTCSQKPERFRVEGLDQFLGPDESGVELMRAIQPVRDLDYRRDLVVVYLDEVHRLVSRHMDEILLKVIEDEPAIWILSTAKPGDLEDMLLNRLLKLETELPAAPEMEEWLCDRCEEWGIKCTPEAIVRVVERSNRVVGTALHALALAATDPEEGLTLDLVEHDWQLTVSE